jgi:hypothetical protein
MDSGLAAARRPGMTTCFGIWSKANPGAERATRWPGVAIAGQFHCVRLDSKLWTGEPNSEAGNPWPVIGVAAEPQPLDFLVPG